MTAGSKSGTLSVSWAASKLRGVTVYAGTTQSSQTHRVATGHGSDSVTVTAAYGSWIRLVPSEGASLVLTVRDLGLASDPNLRDIGGYRTIDGRWVKMGVVYRSQALSLSATDLGTVDRLGITADYDLRTTSEIADSPDVVLAGATYTNLNMLGDTSVTSISGVTSAAAAEAAVYTPFMEVDSSYLQAGFDQVEASYGSMYDYAVQGLGLSPQTIQKLRAKLLVSGSADRR